MSQNKTVFQFQVNANVAVVDNTIRNWLAANQFKFNPKPNANYYAYNDPMIMGKRGFEYYINGNMVTIVAYLGTFEKPTALDDSIVGAVGKQGYRNDLEPLFRALRDLENGAAMNVANVAATAPQTTPIQMGAPTSQPALTPQPTSVPQPAPVQNPAPAQAPMQNSLNTFMDQNTKKRENLVVIGFIISLVGLLATCFGISFGAILIALEYYFAIQGLNTKKKGLAIATIVLASLGILMLLVNIVAAILLA